MRERRKERAVIRHKFLFSLLRLLVSWFFCLRFRYKYEKVRPGKTPAIVLMNHNSDYDPIFAGIAVRGHMYFVASEHAMRMGFFSKLIKFVFDPIIRQKGTMEARAAMEIIRVVRKGHSVCLFAEGNRSFSGETGFILPSTGKLVKRSGAAMITYVLRGGYFSTPRWAFGIRRGLIKGELVNVYSPEQLAQMDDREVYDAIKRDIYVDAYADQRRFNIPYKGKKKTRAKGIEAALYICAKCERIGTIKSSGDRFFCNCGLDMRLDEYGKLAAAGQSPAPFDSILEWDAWQRRRLDEKLKETDDLSKAVFSDNDQTLLEISEAGKETAELLNGKLSFYRDRIEIADGEEKIIFWFREIHDIEVTGRMNITFSTLGGRNLEIRSPFIRSANKYREAFRFIAASVMPRQ